MKAILSYLLLFTPSYHASKGTISGRYSKCYIACYGSAKEDGEISKGFRVLEHSYWEGQCSLSSVSLNQCMDSGSGKKAFYPRVQYSVTLTGYLQVRNEGNSLIVHESGSDSSGDYVNNLRFDYESPGKDKIVNCLTGFSGEYANISILLKKVSHN